MGKMYIKYLYSRRLVNRWIASRAECNGEKTPRGCFYELAAPSPLSTLSAPKADFYAPSSIWGPPYTISPPTWTCSPVASSVSGAKLPTWW